MGTAALHDSVRAFAARDWRAFEAANDAHGVARRRRGGALAALRVVEMLRAHAQAIDPAWPTEDDREADLETHRRVAALLARVPGPCATPPARRRGRARGARRPR